MIDTSGVETQKTFGEGKMPIPLPTPLGLRDSEWECRHEWRIIENFHAEFPREASAPRRYAAYCVYCLMSKGIEVNINQ